MTVRRHEEWSAGRLRLDIHVVSIVLKKVRHRFGFLEPVLTLGMTVETVSAATEELLVVGAGGIIARF